MKEKHRSAQRRYRARLRAKQEEDHARVEELTRELDRMKAQQVCQSCSANGFSKGNAPKLERMKRPVTWSAW